MSQESIIFLYMAGVGIASIVAIVLGVFGLSEEERNNKSSKFYISVNFLIFGILFAIPFILYIFYRSNLIKSISEERFCVLSSSLIVIAMFISGISVLLNKKKIDNPMFIGVATRGLIFSIMGIIALVYYWIRWHGFG